MRCLEDSKLRAEDFVGFGFAVGSAGLEASPVPDTHRLSSAKELCKAMMERKAIEGSKDQ